MDELNSLTFIAKLRSGDPDSFLVLFNRLHGYLAGWVCKSFDLNEQDAEEIAADTLAKVHKKIAQFDARRGTKLTTWIVQIAKNGARDFLRLEKRRHEDQARIMAAGFGQGAGRVDATVSRSSEMQGLVKALGLLGEADRNILYFRQAMSYDEIAELENTSAGAVRTRYARALAKLKALLEKE